MKLPIFVLILVVTSSRSVTNGQGSMTLNHDIVTDFFETDALLVGALIPTDANLRCIKDFEYSVQQLRESRRWALDMFDSWAKGPPSGVFYGNSINYGNFDQCLSVKHQMEQETTSVEGKHCTVTVQVDDPQRKETSVREDIPARPMYQDIRFLPQPTMNR